MYETAVTQTSLSTVWKKDVATATHLKNKLQTLLSIDSSLFTALQSTMVLTPCLLNHKHFHDNMLCLAYKTIDDEKKVRVCNFTLWYTN